MQRLMRQSWHRHCHSQKHRNWHVHSCFKNAWACWQKVTTHGCSWSILTANYDTQSTHLAPSQVVHRVSNPTYSKCQQLGHHLAKSAGNCSLCRMVMCLVGADLSGIELRCLAHYLQDGGEFAREVTSGDIHTARTCTAWV